MSRIVYKEQLSDSVVRMDLEAPEIARKRRPGQFLVLKVNERGERIPLTIVDSDGEKGTVTIIYQIVGKTTALMSELAVGDEIQDVQGPLGNPTEIENYGHVVCIGGGVGVGVIYPITRALKDAGNRVTSIIGARNRSLIILEEEMRAASDKLVVATDDGSYGVHGFVSNVLQGIIDGGEKIDRVFAIGPVPMMKVIANLTRPYGIKTIVSLNAIMVDATGMCGACRVAVGGKTKFTCVDGPEFDGHEVDFDLLTSRLRMYCEQEGQSYERHRCGWQGN
ncbi:MAG TPA: sulfide/dihydroorotate dehydrogenase-like FAD/NAD-binding protein [Syntrophales bacterium]|nr:sulfide/dihydroorotate dehydrogenase-like FAD/NAD-binding protein [Syntrophales bacterium]HOU78255.1 sulfide/dihydroorotate dehydrogenase-like FAD/NAD-binding protein [Syntrophales bacterium]HPC31544.1 sulfide/dihydroorotate dehydrogenase-like FAD/NAD-binding protein [Syntrophales bacterium]HQG34785.1 sulfide/dihydroorotate dehydrogenase-like FAD/NAD-binding protein [Syntrophales bacterium]HQJ30996.1 sulfide/dihydroorotate dehydrogenase-like FAD/NAD-binding protein [Syntrophales bacterium]